MANKYQKPVSALQNQRADRVNRRTLLLPVTSEPFPAPRCPDNLQAGAQRRWRKFWSSPVAPAVDMRADGEAIERWAHCLSERERLQPLADKTPLVKGSVGQLAPNPLYAIIREFSKEIARLEEHFGMTPLARMRLGLTQVQRDLGVSDLRRRLDRSGEARDAIEAEATEVEIDWDAQ